jgi:peptide/nickel transport system substrate-binding protein
MTKRNTLSAVAMLVCGVAVAAATSSDPTSARANSKSVNTGELTVAIASDPGNLDPQSSPVNVNLQLAVFAYDSLVGESPTGSIVPQLAKTWHPVKSGYVFTLRKGITCSDGSALKASTVAANFNYVEDPASRSPLYGGIIPPGLTASADNAIKTVTLRTAKPFPFILQAASQLPIVCQKGLDSRSALARSTYGSGPYVLTSAAPGNQYVYRRRTGYLWGPGNAKAAATKLPGKVIFKVVKNETTAANLLLAGQVNIGVVRGPDRKRLQAAKLFSQSALTPMGEMFFNQAQGHPGSEGEVRRALSRGANLTQVGQVLSGGFGVTPTGLISAAPKPCRGNTVAGNVPSYDTAAAEQLLTQDGWTPGSGGIRTKGGQQLAITLLFDPNLTSTASSAAELLAQQWHSLGVDVHLDAQPISQIQTRFATGAWDAVWLPITASLPSALTPFFFGPAPPQGLNFAHISNAAYDNNVAAASAKEGAASCASWNKAEAALLRSADVVPFVDSKIPTWGKKATFALVGGDIVPTSIRIVAH